MLSEDANGQSKVITVCLLVQEDANSITWMVNAFKKNNKDWHKIRIVMADKDIGEREVLKQCIPNVSVLICLFHTLRTFRREISCKKKWEFHLAKGVHAYSFFRNFAMRIQKLSMMNCILNNKPVLLKQLLTTSMKAGIL